MSKIVIVDDQAVNRAIYAKMAASIGIAVQVETFATPHEALTAIQNHVPDLIVTDYLMPGMSGADLIRRIRRQPALTDIPVIAITAYEEASYRFNALDAGATDFLLSPVNQREFTTRARNLLRLRKQQLLLAGRAKRLEREIERKEQSLEQIVRDSSQRLAQVIDCVPALISATDRNGRVLFVNECHAQVFGIDPNTVVGRDVYDLYGEENCERRRALDRLVLRTNRPAHGFEEEIIDCTGNRRVFYTTKSPLSDGANRPCGVVTSAIDITEQKIAHQHLHFMAHHDSLTGLPNRAYLSERTGQEIARARRGDRRFALHVIDLDGFKQVNDTRGHACGDRFLRAVSERLRSLERAGCIIGRMGGDEFVAFQPELRNSDAAAQLAEDICRIFREPFMVDDMNAIATASIGIARYPADGRNFDELWRHADAAMYEAKAKGGNRYIFYSSDLAAPAPKTASLDARLRMALERHEFELHYQPQVHLSTGEVTGAEALLRWRAADGTLIHPEKFLLCAEENELILPISEWALREACNQISTWRRWGLPAIRVGINVSPVQFRRETLPLLVTQALSESGVSPSSLELELTENFLLHDVDRVTFQLQELRALGLSISIDDFGTGFSSLSYLKRLPIDRLKIDQSFIHDLVSDPSDRAIVASIINLAQSLKLKVIAEGVESELQIECLRAAGCDEVQGFYFGRPMSAEAFANFIAPTAKMAQAG